MLTASKLEHASAFDQAAAWLADVRGPVLAVLSTAESVDLLLARGTWPVVLSCDAPSDLAHASARLAQGLVPEVIAKDCRAVGPVETLQSERRFEGALWASPRRGAAGAKLLALARLLAPESPLCLLVGARLPASLRRGLASKEWQPQPEVRGVGSLARSGLGRKRPAGHAGPSPGFRGSRGARSPPGTPTALGGTVSRAQSQAE